MAANDSWDVTQSEIPLSSRAMTLHERPQRSFLKRGLSLLGGLIAVVTLVVLWRHLHGIDLSRLVSAMRAYHGGVIAAASASCIASFLLLGFYEAAMLRSLGQRLGFARPLLVNTIATPIGHAIGLALLTAGAIRYRLYVPWGVSKATTGKVIVLSAFPFLLGMMVLFDLSLLFGAHHAAPALHLPSEIIRTLGVIGLAKDVFYLWLTAARRGPFKFGKFSIQLPSFRFTLLQLALGSIEILCVALVLYLFMPPELNISAAAFVTIYLVGIVVGQLSNIPAGLGVLEASLLLMLPQIAPEKLLAAVFAYRVIFEAAPLMVALVLLGGYEAVSRHGLGGRWWRRSGPP